MKWTKIKNAHVLCLLILSFILFSVRPMAYASKPEKPEDGFRPAIDGTSVNADGSVSSSYVPGEKRTLTSLLEDKGGLLDGDNVDAKIRDSNQFYDGGCAGEDDGSGTFSFLQYPDTQVEADQESELLLKERTKWARENCARLRIKWILHVGDIVGYSSDDEKTWKRVDRAMKTIEKAKIPYHFTVGNHDVGIWCRNSSGSCRGGTGKIRDTLVYNHYFSPKKQKIPEKQVFEKGKAENSYKLYNVGGAKWLTLALELDPRVRVVDWAAKVIESHPKHNVIIFTHDLLSIKGSISCITGGGYSDVYYGEDPADTSYCDSNNNYFKEKFLYKYPNIKMTFSGHMGQYSSRIDTGINGNKIFHIMTSPHSKDRNETRVVRVNVPEDKVESWIVSASDSKGHLDGVSYGGKVFVDSKKEYKMKHTYDSNDDWRQEVNDMKFIKP